MKMVFVYQSDFKDFGNCGQQRDTSRTFHEIDNQEVVGFIKIIQSKSAKDARKALAMETIVTNRHE